MSSINILNMRSVFSSLSARRKKEQDKGATLMEVLLVVGVIVVLAASAYKLYSWCNPTFNHPMNKTMS